MALYRHTDNGKVADSRAISQMHFRMYRVQVYELLQLLLRLMQQAPPAHLQCCHVGAWPLDQKSSFLQRIIVTAIQLIFDIMPD